MVGLPINLFAKLTRNLERPKTWRTLISSPKVEQRETAYLSNCCEPRLATKVFRLRSQLFLNRRTQKITLCINVFFFFRSEPNTFKIVLAYLSHWRSCGIVVLNNCKYWNHYHRSDCKNPTEEFGPCRVRLCVIANAGPLSQACQNNNLQEEIKTLMNI